MKKLTKKKSVFCVVMNDEIILSEINRKNNLNYFNLEKTDKNTSSHYANYLKGKRQGYITGIQIITGNDFSIAKYLRILKVLANLKSGRNLLNGISAFGKAKFLNGEISALENVIKIIKKFNDIDLTTVEI